MTHAAPDARFWDAIAEDYARRPLPNPEATARKLAVVRAMLRPTDRLLDLGCGTGTILLELAPHVAEAHGVDLSPGMIAIATRKAAAAGIENVRFRAQAASGLDDMADATWDHVCAFNLLHLVDDPAALVRSIFRVLRPGGHFSSATACMGGRWFPPYFLVLPVMRLLGKAPPVTMLTLAELRAALTDAGFEAIDAPEVGAAADHVFLTARKPG
jgi:SAM-dependent methyltransferase